MILIMAVLMGLSLLAVPISMLIDRLRSDSADPANAVAVDDASDNELDAGCGPTPDDIPEVSSEIYDEPFERSIDPQQTYEAVLDTTCGQIVLELDAADAPIATNNLVNLAESGYYDGVVFHRVLEGFVVQVGDPAGTGCGQQDCTPEGFDPEAPTYPGYEFEDELTTAQELYGLVRDQQVERLVAEGQLDEDEIDDEVRALLPAGYPRGTVSMANAGPDTNGSQFFLAQGDPTMLPGPNYTVLGRVVEGMDVVDTIASSATDQRDRPREDIVVRGITIRTGN